MKILRNAVIGGFGSSVVALLYRGSSEVTASVEANQDIPDALKNLDANDIANIKNVGILNEGSTDVQAVKSWQRILNAVLGDDVNPDGDFGPNTKSRTILAQKKLEEIFKLNGDTNNKIDADGKVAGEMKAVLVCVEKLAVKGELEKTKEQVTQKVEVDTKGKKVEAGPKVKKNVAKKEKSKKKESLKKSVTPKSNEVALVIGNTPQEMTNNLSLKDRQKIVQLIPEPQRFTIVNAQISKKGKGHFGGTDGQNKALFDYLSEVEVKPTSTVDVNGVSVDKEALATVRQYDVAVVRTLRKTSRYQQVKREFGIGKGSNLAKAAQLAKDLTAQVEKTQQSTGFEHDFKKILEKAVDGRRLEGGVVGLFTAGFDALSKDSRHGKDIDALAKKYGIQKVTMRQQYDAYVHTYETKYASDLKQFDTDPVGYLVQEIGLDKPTVEARMKNDKNFLVQTRRFLARDLVAAALSPGFIPLTHVRTGFQKDVHRVLDYGTVSESVLRSNALEDMKKTVVMAEASSAELLNHLGKHNYRALRNPSKANKYPKQGLSNTEKKYVSQLKAAAAAIGIAINGGDGKTGAIEITVTDADRLRKHSYNFFEAFPLIGGDAKEVRKVKSAIRTLESKKAATHEKVQALKDLGRLFDQELQEDFGKENQKKNVEAVIGVSEAEFKTISLKKRIAFARKYPDMFNGYGEFGYQNKNGKWVSQPGYTGMYMRKGGKVFEQNDIVMHALKTRPSLFKAFCKETGFNAQSKVKMKSKQSERLGLISAFARSSHYTGTLLKAQNLHEQGANVLEKGNAYEKALMGLLSRFSSFEDLKNYDGLIVGNDVKPFLQKYYAPGKGVEGRSLALVREIKKSKAVREWAKNVSNYLNGKKAGYMKYHAKVVDQQARALSPDLARNIEQREKNKYAGDLDAILGKNPSKSVLAHYVQHTEVEGQMLSGLLSNQVHQLTGANISPSQIIGGIARSAQPGTVSGHNTAFNTTVAGQNNYKGRAYAFTVPASEPYTILSGEGKVAVRMTEYRFALKPGCTNLVLVDHTGKQIDLRKIMKKDNHISEHERILVGVHKDWFRNKKQTTPETPETPKEKLDTTPNLPETPGVPGTPGTPGIPSPVKNAATIQAPVGGISVQKVAPDGSTFTGRVFR